MQYKMDEECQQPWAQSLPCVTSYSVPLEFETSKEIGDKRYLFIGDNVRITLKKNAVTF